jgi:hypothetical protein
MEHLPASCRHCSSGCSTSQLREVGVELLYVLYKLAYANPLGLLEHIGKVVLFLLSCVVGKHSEDVEHNAFIE